MGKHAMHIQSRWSAIVVAVLVIAWAGLVLPAPAQAHPHWHGHIERFHEHDLHIWRGGHWVQRMMRMRRFRCVYAH